SAHSMSMAPSFPHARQSRITAWLTAEVAQSAAQASAQRLWFGWLRFLGNPLAVAGLAVVVGLLLVAMFAPWLDTHDPFAQDLAERLRAPDAHHWFGTDQVGRDLYSRVVYGSRVTLDIVFLVVLIVGPIGLLIGAVAGYAGGTVG